MLLDFLGIFAVRYLVNVQSTITQEPPHQRCIFHGRSVMILPLEKQRIIHGLLLETFPAHPHPQKEGGGGGVFHFFSSPRIPRHLIHPAMALSLVGENEAKMCESTTYIQHASTCTSTSGSTVKIHLS